tara:strand:- start:256 stop:762 length:507 start_codon:yes stop_codon:yes gene_type:complete
VVKYAKDDRYSEECASTHDKQTWKAFPCTTLASFTEADDFDVIGIDEGQFFPDVVEFTEDMANRGKVVIVAALDGTFQKQPFGTVLNLVPLAESVVKLSAVCMMCHQRASFTRRLGNETQVELIGGTDKYLSVCRKCFSRPPEQPCTPNKKRVYSDVVNPSMLHACIM